MSDVPEEIPPPTAQGSFAKTPFPQVLVYVLERGLTGTIEMIAPAEGSDGRERKARLLVLDGLPSKMQTSEPVAYLGNVLRQLGFIDDAQLNMSLAQLSKASSPGGDQKRLHGQILMGAGVIDHAQLVQALRVQLVRKIEHIIDWPPETRFAYYDGFDALASYGADDFVQVDSLPLVWAAIRQSPPWEHVHATLTRVGNAGLRLVAAADVERFELAKDERAAVEMLRERALRVHELVACKIVSAAATQLLAYCMLITKQVELATASNPAPAPTSGSPPNSAPVSSQNAAAEPAGQKVARVQLQQVAQPAVRGAVEEQHTVSRMDQRVASPLPPRGDSEAQVMPPPSKKISIANMVAVSAPPSSSKVRSQKPVLSPVHEARKKEILDRFAIIKGQNYFEMLGVGKDASIEQVQAAFFQLAKVWHPDRVPAFLADVKEQCATVFSHMSEAHQTLVDPKRREGYMKLLKEGGATPDDQAQIAAVIDAATNFQKAEICLRRSDYTQAESLCRKAHELDPQQPEYIALLAWLESMKPEKQGPEPTMACIAMLDQALATNDKLERAYFYRGMLHKRLQNGAAAVRDFRRASELNPRNIDAVREVRLFEMRKGRNSVPPPPASARGGSDRPSKAPPAATPGAGPAPKLSGLFGKLFKK